MDSEAAAQQSAQQKHHKHMMFGKKQRYIEVFQCSGEDMNLVLNGAGGYQYQNQFPSPPAISAKPIASSGMLPSRPQQPAQPLQISIPPPLTLSLPQSAVALQNAAAANASNAAAVVAASTGAGNQSANSLIAQQQQAHFIAQQSLMARQQAAAAAAQLQAAQQQNDQMAFFQNFSFLQSPTSGGMAPGMQPSPYSFPMSPQMPQFYFLPRPMGLPMSMMPPNALGQMQYSLPPSAAAAYASQVQNASHMSAATGSVQQVSSQLASTSNKRSYESAFRSDPMNVSAAKRVYNPSQAANNIYGTYPYPQL